MKFYTHVYSASGGIYYRGYENGSRVAAQIKTYKPSLFVPTIEESPYKNIYGEKLQRLQFNSISAANRFIEQNEQDDQKYVYGMTRYHFAYIGDEFPNTIHYDESLIRKATLDIEVDTSNGFASVDDPFASVLTITIRIRKVFYVFGLKPYKTNRTDVRYIYCRDEHKMLQTFLSFWKQIDVDILFGWNTDGYDIPYLVNRLRRLFDKKGADDLSPWGIIRNIQINFKGQPRPAFELVGIASLDYQDLYRRYMPKLESEALNFVAEHELGEKKLDYTGSLHDLYVKDFNKFIEYNIQDVALVEKLDEKLSLSSMVIATAYDAKCNYTDVQQQVRMWDAICFNALKKKKIAVPLIKTNHKANQYAGAYVLPTQAGKRKWIVSFDFASLYPSIIMEHNISPEMMDDHVDRVLNPSMPCTPDNFVAKEIDLSQLPEKDLVCTGSGWLFKYDGKGFLGEILEGMFADRKRFKDLMQESKQKYEKAADEEERRSLSFDIAKYHNYQWAKKIQLNAAYGSLGNQYFRFFDIRLAVSVTLTGQTLLLWVKNKIFSELKKKYQLEHDPIVYGDTDSLYISALPFVESLPEGLSQKEILDLVDKEYCAKELNTIIQSALHEFREYFNTPRKRLNMVRDVICEDAIFVSKKRYLMEMLDAEGVRFAKPKRKVLGLEMIKSTTPKFCKEWLDVCTDYLLKRSPSELTSLVEKYREEFNQMPLEKISYPVNMSDLEKYVTPTGLRTGAPIQVTAAYHFNRQLEKLGLSEKYDPIKPGSRIRFFYLKDANPFGTHVMGMLDRVPPELELHQWIDYHRQFEKVFVGPLNILLKAIGWRQVEEPPSVLGIFDD